MGACYSRQAQSGKRTYPSDMSLSSDAPGRGGRGTTTALGRPAYLYKKVPPANNKAASHKKGKEKDVEKSTEKEALIIVEHPRPTNNADKNVRNLSSRFGFGLRPPNRGPYADSNRNVMSHSNDSIDSVDSNQARIPASTGSLRRKLNQRGGPFSFQPKEADRWRMIDDSSTTTGESRPTSTATSPMNEFPNGIMDGFVLDKNGNAAAVVPADTNNVPARSAPVSDTQTVNNMSTNTTSPPETSTSIPTPQFKGASRLPTAGTSKMPTRMKYPTTLPSTDRWIKAGLCGPVDANNKTVQAPQSTTNKTGKQPGPKDTSTTKKTKFGFASGTSNSSSKPKAEVKSSQKKFIPPSTKSRTPTTGAGQKSLGPRGSKDSLVQSGRKSPMLRPKDMSSKNKESQGLDKTKLFSKEKPTMRRQVATTQDPEKEQTREEVVATVAAAVSQMQVSSDEVFDAEMPHVQNDLNRDCKQSVERTEHLSHITNCNVGGKESISKTAQVIKTDKPPQRPKSLKCTSFAESLSPLSPPSVESTSEEVSSSPPTAPVEDVPLPSEASAPLQKPAPVPLTRTDSAETGSISSINSDDLMLDLDIDLEEDLMEQSISSLDRSVFSLSRSMSRSGDFDKSMRARKNLFSESGLPRYQSSNVKQVTRPRMNSTGEREAMRPRLGSSTSEAVEELGHLLSESPAQLIHRRNPRLQSSSRPASFPGPVRSRSFTTGSTGSTGSEGAEGQRPVVLKPPRTHSIADDDVVPIDGFTFRHLSQDLTNAKTMLHKLKRVIQTEEVGSPLNPAWKNGFKLAGTPRTPESPLVHDLESKLDGARLFTSLLEKKEQGPTALEFSQVQQENAELRQQLALKEQMLEEKERTILLLQQQMTKYECGHFGPGGKERSNATTQTDKPRFAVSKGVLRPSSKGRPGEAQPVISSPQTRRRVQTDRQNGVNGETDEEEADGDYDYDDMVEVDENQPVEKSTNHSRSIPSSFLPKPKSIPQPSGNSGIARIQKRSTTQLKSFNNIARA